MFSEKSVLIERIHIAIKNKWAQKGADIFVLPPNPSLTTVNTNLTDNKYFTYTKNTEAIEKLEHRIEGLEKQNDQLLHFINFLLENLPDMVANILHPFQEMEHAFDNHAGTNENCEVTARGNCNHGKNEPCPTRREKDVLELLAKGLCAKEIAHKLFISETTVITHKKNLKEKFNARNTAELISKTQSHIKIL